MPAPPLVSASEDTTVRPPWYKPEWISVAVLQLPLVIGAKRHRGALISNQVDAVVQRFPTLPQNYFLIERRGWRGMNASRHADIKLVEDLSTLDQTRTKFPHAILLPIGPADFVDLNVFTPSEVVPKYDVIQIACWSERKRIDLMIEAASRIPSVSFVHLGHFEHSGTEKELQYRDRCLNLIKSTGANITVPFFNARSNDTLPGQKSVINEWINQSKIGLLTSAIEGINRFKMECLAANRPMLVSSDACTPTQKHINARTGVFFEPNPVSLAVAVVDMLAARDRYSPRKYLLEATGKARSLALLKTALAECCRRTNEVFHFDAIDWDGRNQSLTWGEAGLHLLGQLSSSV